VITSTVGGYTAIVDNGLITIYWDGYASTIVGPGTAVQLLDSDSLYLFWITDTGALHRSTVSLVDNTITLSTPAVVAPAVFGFFVKDIPGYGIAYAYVYNSALHINLLGTNYVGTWDLTRLHDFTFDVSTDLQTLSLLYMKPGSPVQAFVDYYGIESSVVTTTARLRLYDFELGAHPLEANVAPVT
jgi:hypothetical protein